MRKFRGADTASNFFKVLYDHGMTDRQVQVDFFLEVEASSSKATGTSEELLEILQN